MMQERHTLFYSSLRAQLLSVEIVIIIVIFLFIFSVLFIYYWGVLKRTENVLTRSSTKLLFSDIGKRLAYLFATGKFGNFKVYIPPDKYLANDYYSLYIVNENKLNKKIYENTIPTNEFNAIAFINLSAVADISNWKNFVKNGGELIIYVPDSYFANFVYNNIISNVSLDLKNKIKLVYNNINGLAIISKVYYAREKYLSAFKNYNGYVYFVLNNSSPWEGIDIIEYLQYNGSTYLLAFKIPYGKGSIIIVTDPELYNKLKHQPQLSAVLGEVMRLDPNSQVFVSNIREVINPYFYTYTYVIYACNNLIIFTQGFSKIEIYKINNVTENGLNLTLYYSTYSAGVVSIPLPGCGGYFIKTTAPAKIYSYARGGFVSLLTQHAIIPVTRYLIICGYNTTVKLIFRDKNGEAMFSFPSIFPKCIYLDLKNVSGYDYSNSLIEIISLNNPVFIYFTFGELEFDSISVPPLVINNSVIYYIPKLKFEYNGKIYYYWLVIYSILDNSTRNVEIFDGKVTTSGKNIIYHNATLIRFYQLIFYPPQSNVIKIIGTAGVKVILLPVIYNSSTYNLDTSTSIINSFGALYLPDSFILMPLLSNNSAGLYSIVVYTSAVGIDLRFYAFKSTYSSLPIFDVYNLKVSNLKNYLTELGGTPRLFIANITYPDFYCEFNNGNKLFITINNAFLAKIAQQGLCKCFNESSGKYYNCTMVSLRSGDVYYITNIIKGGTL